MTLVRATTEHELEGPARVEGATYMQAFYLARGATPDSYTFPMNCWWQIHPAYGGIYCYEEDLEYTRQQREDLPDVFDKMTTKVWTS